MTLQNNDWIEKANCKGQSELFFGSPSERPSARRRREIRARQICLECNVLLQCRSFARQNNELGYWGAESEEDRFDAGYLNNAYIRRKAKVRESKKQAQV